MDELYAKHLAQECIAKYERYMSTEYIKYRTKPKLGFPSCCVRFLRVFRLRPLAKGNQRASKSWSCGFSLGFRRIFGVTRRFLLEIDLYLIEGPFISTHRLFPPREVISRKAGFLLFGAEEKVGFLP